MKEKELREIATCNNCGEKIGASKSPFFYRVKIKQYGLDMSALNRQSGLETFFSGNVQIAQAMSANEDLAKVLQSREVTICENCSSKDVQIIFLMDEESDG